GERLADAHGGAQPQRRREEVLDPPLRRQLQRQVGDGDGDGCGGGGGCCGGGGGAAAQCFEPLPQPARAAGGFRWLPGGDDGRGEVVEGEEEQAREDVEDYSDDGAADELNVQR